jgi:hypothetical protein
MLNHLNMASNKLAFELGALTKGLDLTAAGVKFDPVKEDRRWRSPF